MQGNNYNIKKIVLIGVIILLLFLVIGFLVIRSNQNSQTGTSAKNLFPFGTTQPSGTGSTTASGTTTTNGVGTIPSTGNPLQSVSGERLRQITDYPVTGFFPSVASQVISNPSIDPKTQKTIFTQSILPTDMLRWNVKQTGILIDGTITADSIIENQKTNTQIPLAQEILFGSNGNSVVYRTWNSQAKTINSLLGMVPNQTSLSYCQTPFTKILKKGSTGALVKEAQKYLDEKLKIGLPLDGSFGSKMSVAVEQLQPILNVPITGIFDAATETAVNADCATITKTWNTTQSKPLALTSLLLDDGISRGVASPDGTKYFVLEPNSNGVVGIVINSDGSGAKQVFSSALSEWMPQWVNANTIAMTTLASGQAVGYLYFLDLSTGNFTKILGPVQGLTTLTSPDLKKVLFSQTASTGFITRIFDTTTGAVGIPGITTLPEKCTWQNNTILDCGVPDTVPSGLYPDDWYQGIATFGDTLWTIDTKNNTINIIVSPSETFDITHLAASPDSNYLYFINKNDGTLWSYRIGN